MKLLGIILTGKWLEKYCTAKDITSNFDILTSSGHFGFLPIAFTGFRQMCPVLLFCRTFIKYLSRGLGFIRNLLGLSRLYLYTYLLTFVQATLESTYHAIRTHWRGMTDEMLKKRRTIRSSLMPMD